MVGRSGGRQVARFFTTQKVTELRKVNLRMVTNENHTINEVHIIVSSWLMKYNAGIQSRVRIATNLAKS
jgi:hypothetical protein